MTPNETAATPDNAAAADATQLERMRTLVARLNEAADAYYAGRQELMTDYEWDAAFDELRSLEAATGVVLAHSPTAKVSSDNLDGEKVRHEFPALSLAKTKSVAEVARWSGGRTLWLSWKLDGLTLVATYDGGELRRLVTRGDGATGTNITRLASAIAGIPRSIPFSGHLVVRGEAVISYADFEEFCAESKEVYANPRNLASGSLSLKDADEVKARRIRWIPFTPVHVDAQLAPSWGERMAFLESLGFACVERERIDSPSPELVQSAIERWTRRVTSRENPYPVDGLVVCYDDLEYASGGTVTGHHATRAGLAFKWADETAETALERIEWSCAVASIAPVAVFEPVALEGTTVRRASLCNVSECERLGIGAKGTRLEVIKANKIIPKVVRVVSKNGEFSLPEKCPVCGAATELRTSASGTKTLVCTNAECPARELRKFMRFVSKDGMDIDGLAGASIAKFINRGFLKTVADVYRLGEHSGEIAAMEGFGAKSAEKLAAAITAARRRSAVNIVTALSIPLCGKEVARLMLAGRTLRELFETDAATLAGIDGIGPAKSEAFVKWATVPAHRALVDDLLSLVEVEEYEPPPAAGKCAGLSFVITGDLARYPNRAALKEYIESQGGKVSSAVSAKTNFLISNDAGSTSSKTKKAQKLGIAVITEEEFAERFG